MVDEIRVTIVATGIGDIEAPEMPMPHRQQQPIQHTVGESRPLQPANLSGHPTPSSGYGAQQGHVPPRPTDLTKTSILDTPITARTSNNLQKDENLFNVQNFIRNTDK